MSRKGVQVRFLSSGPMKIKKHKHVSAVINGRVVWGIVSPRNYDCVMDTLSERYSGSFGGPVLGSCRCVWGDKYFGKWLRSVSGAEGMDSDAV